MKQQGTPVVAKQNFVLESVITDGHERRFLRTSDSANVLIYIRDLQKLLLVSQKREAMACPDNPRGIIVESVAGRFDREETVRQLLAREASEEVGGTIDPDAIELLNHGAPMALSAGCLTEHAWLGFVEIDSSQLEQADRTYGLAEEGEHIQRVFFGIESLDDCAHSDVRVFALIQWFLRNKMDKR